MNNPFDQFDVVESSAVKNSQPAANPFDQFDEPKQSPEEINNQINASIAERQAVKDRGFFNNAVRGAGERAAELAGNFVDGVAALEADRPDKSMQPIAMGMPMQQPRSQEQRDTVRASEHETANRLRGVDLGYDENRNTLDGAKTRFEKGDYLGAAFELWSAGNESALTSAPDMVASASGVLLPAYILSRSGEIANENAKNQGKPMADAGDVAQAAPFAVAASMLERILPKRLARSVGEISDESAKQISDEAVRHVMKKAASEAGKSALIEGGTEFIQEGVIEYIGTRYGTDVAMDVREAFAQGAEAAILGGVGGSTMGAAKGAYDGVSEARQANRMSQPIEQGAPADITPRPIVDEAAPPQQEQITPDQSPLAEPLAPIAPEPVIIPPKPLLQQTPDDIESELLAGDPDLDAELAELYRELGNVEREASELLSIIDDAPQASVAATAAEPMIAEQAPAVEQTINPFDQFDDPAIAQELPQAIEPQVTQEIPQPVEQIQGLPTAEEVAPAPIEPAAELASQIDAAAAEAATSPLNDLPEPTEAQRESGNYKKGHVKIQGLDISIENPRGSTRSGVDPDGKPWSNKMHSHYGYIRKTEASDGDAVDVFIGPNPESQKVFVVDQVNADGSYDESKVLIGYDSRLKARSGYKSNYSNGWKVGPITSMTMDEFKAWTKSGDTKKPLQPDHFVGATKAVNQFEGNLDMVSPKGIPTKNETGVVESKTVMPERIYVGMGSFKPKPIGKPLYRETNAAGIDDLIRDALSNNAERGSVTPTFVADSPDIALGQGDNKGARVLFDGSLVSGGKNKKPGSEALDVSEYKTDYINKDSILAFSVPKNQQLRGLTKVMAAREFDKTDFGDRTLYTKKGIAKDADLSWVSGANQEPIKSAARVKPETKAKPAPSNQETVKQSVGDLPAILTETKTQSLKKMAAERGIKKGSPGYADAISRLADKYESEVDRAQAALPFEQFNELNSDTPESINRQAYDALREEFGIQGPSVREGESLYSPNDRKTSNVQSRGHNQSSIQEPATETGRGSQLDLLLHPQADKRKAYADIFGTVIKARPVTRVSSAINRIDSISDVAHVLASIRKDPQESFYAIATDSKGEILRIMNFTRGTADSASVYPLDVVAEAASIEGATTLHLAHNHPSGTAQASSADERITQKIFDMLDGTGISPGHHAIIARTNWADGASKYGFNAFIPPQARTKFSLPITQRRIAKDGELGEKIVSPESAMRVTANHKNALFLLNNQNAPVAILQMSPSEMEKLRDGGHVSRILSAINKSNARAAIIKTNEKDAAANIARLLNSLEDINVLDWISDAGSDAQKAGSVANSSGSFFSLGNNRDTATTSASRTVSEADANKVIARIRAGIANKGLEIKAVDSFAAFPDEVKAHAKREGHDGKNVEGVFHKGAIYVNREALANAAEVERVIFHELYGHYGLRKMFGGTTQQAMGSLYLAVGGAKGINELSKKHGVDLRHYAKGLIDAGAQREVLQAIMMEELLAHIAQSSKPSVTRRLKELLGKLRGWLRKAGFIRTSEVTDSELMYLLRQARDAVHSGVDGRVDPGTFMAVSQPMFSLKINQTETAAFKSWFGDSKVVNADGKPRVMYHGTAANFNEFSKKKATDKEGRKLGFGWGKDKFYFAETGEAASSAAEFAQMTGRGNQMNVMPVYLSVQNPIIAEAYKDLLAIEQKSGLSRDAAIAKVDKRIRAQGYDGIIDSESRGVAVFNPTQIKSATGNTGTFDPDNPDIRFSLAAKGDRQFSSPDESIADNRFAKAADTVLRVWADKMRPLLNTQREIQKVTGSALSEDVNAYLAEELFHGKTENDLRKMEERFIDPMVEKMAKYQMERSELDMYLWAVHAPERNKQIAKINPTMKDGGSGMSTAQALDILKKAKAEGRLLQLADVAQHVYAMLKQRREIMKGSLQEDGMIDAWDDVYKYYVPLKGRAADESGGKFPRVGKGFDIRGKETLRALGRRTKPESPVLHTIRDTTETIIRYRKNEVGNVFLGLVEKYPNPDYWNVYTSESPELQPRLKTVGGKEVVGEGAVIDKNKYFITKKNGKEYYIDLKDEKLLRAMKNMGPEPMNMVMQFMGKISRFLSSMNTTYNPEFTITNFARDIQTAVINMLAEQDLHDGKAKGEKIAATMVKGVPFAIRAIHASMRKKTLTGKYADWQKSFEDFQNDGAKTGWFDMKDIDGQAKDLENLINMRKKSVKGLALRTKKTIGDFVENVNGAIENGVRLSAYKSAVDAGISRKQAASLAKNLTVNFNRKGEIGQAMNSLYMFFNASVQGTAAFARAIGTFRINPDGTRSLNLAQKMGIGIAMSAFGLALLNREMAGEDDDEINWYDKVPDYVKERNIVIMKSIVGGEPGEYWTIPLPYGYNIFNVIGTSAEASIVGTKGIGKSSADIMKAFFGSFSPIGIAESNSVTGSVVRTITPTVGKPLVDIAANENFFGGPVYRENFQFGTPKPESQLSMRSTNVAWKWLAEFMNDATGGSQFRSGAVDVSPDKLGYVFDYLVGSSGAFYSKIVHMGLKTAQGRELEDREIPFLRKVSGKVMRYEDQTKFYERKDEIGQAEKEWKALTGSERIKFYKEHSSIIRMKGALKQTEDRLKDLRKRRDAIEEDESLSEKTKDARLELIEKQIKQHVDRFNKRWPDQ